MLSKKYLFSKLCLFDVGDTLNNNNKGRKGTKQILISTYNWKILLETN